MIKMISPQSFYIRVCLKIAFRQLCVPLCRRFGPNEGGIAGMNFQTPLYYLTWHVLPIHAFNPCILQLKLTKLER